MRLVQFLGQHNERRVGTPSDDGRQLEALEGGASIRELALEAIALNVSLPALAARRLGHERFDYGALLESGRVLAPLDHPDLARLFVTGTGLTHLGSAQSRDAMHATLEQDASPTDSLRMFKLGLEGGRPLPGQIGAQPEWFYKGDGGCVRQPGAALEWPGYAEDAGDEIELVALYVIAPDRTPYRIGFALGNEYADHIMEQRNYLYLAHSKLRDCSFGPELLISPLPPSVTGTARVRRGATTVWQSEFLVGEDNMAHSLANLEHHHFKYAQFRRPGAVHAHFLGAAVLSFSAGLRLEDGDQIEIESDAFGRALRNTVRRRPEAQSPVTVRSLDGATTDSTQRDGDYANL